MRGVEVKHVRRNYVDLEKVWDVESTTGKGVLYVGHSKNETSKRRIPLNGAARDPSRGCSSARTNSRTRTRSIISGPRASTTTTTRPSRRKSGTVPGGRCETRPACPASGSTILRHTVVTDLLEAGEPEHVIQAVTGQLSKKMLEHYSHQWLKAKGQMLERMEVRRKKGTA
jgi:integrase